MSREEKSLVIELKALNAKLTASAIAKLLRRRKAPIACLLEDARQKLQASAPVVAEHMLRASVVASRRGDAGPAQWILERISARKDDGSEVRVVEPAKQVQSAQGLTVNVGLSVGNIPGASLQPILVSTLPTLPASLPIEGEQVALSDSSDET